MINYEKPDFYVTEFTPNEYIAACNGQVSITGKCSEGGGFTLGGGTYYPESGVVDIPGGGQLYTKGTLPHGPIFAGTIRSGTHKDGVAPRVDGEYTLDKTNASESLTYCGDCKPIGKDENTPIPAQHHHLETVTVNNGS